MESLYYKEFKPLRRCNHVFHEECMADFLKVKRDEKALPIKCPAAECD